MLNWLFKEVIEEVPAAKIRVGDIIEDSYGDRALVTMVRCYQEFKKINLSYDFMGSFSSDEGYWHLEYDRLIKRVRRQFRWFKSKKAVVK